MDNKAFSKCYKEITKPIETDFEKLDAYFEIYFDNLQKTSSPKHIVPILKDFFSVKGKRIRSALIFLFTKALNKETDETILKLALAEEFIHNATLIHDDIIDCSMFRREKKTLNFEHDNKLAVLAGDYLLTEAMKILSSLGDGNIYEKIRNIHTQCLSEIVDGELCQYFSRYKLLTIEQYIEKSKAKTAKLFEAGIVSAYLKNTNENEKRNIEQIKDFAQYFGIAFQIKNDLDNLNTPEKIGDDIKNGDYSAPLIYYAEEKNITEINNPALVLKKLKTTSAIEKTENLLHIYINKAIENLAILEDNLYKQALICLCKLFTK